MKDRVVNVENKYGYKVVVEYKIRKILKFYYDQGKDLLKKVKSEVNFKVGGKGKNSYVVKDGVFVFIVFYVKDVII